MEVYVPCTTHAWAFDASKILGGIDKRLVDWLTEYMIHYAVF